jgi:hypothetical protein
VKRSRGEEEQRSGGERSRGEEEQRSGGEKRSLLLCTSAPPLLGSGAP